MIDETIPVTDETRFRIAMFTGVGLENVFGRMVVPCNGRAYEISVARGYKCSIREMVCQGQGED